MKANSEKYFLAGVSIFSILSFNSIFGFRFLDIRYIDWLFHHGDTAMGQIAWQYFSADSWRWPPGVNHNYGVEFSSGILMSDSNAFFALIFKLLPIDGPYQYFGIWLFICFLLQGWVAFKIAHSLGISLVGASLFAAFCVVSPIMVWRMYGHFNLVGHWLILMALYFYFSRVDFFFDVWRWALLILVSILVHPYIGIMCCLVFAGYLGEALLAKKYTFFNVALMGGGGVFSFLFALWLGGYFLLGRAGGEGGFGFFRMNLLSFIQPVPAEWSKFFKVRDGFGAGDYEGNAYMGLGFLLLLLVGLPYFWRNVCGSWRKHVALIGVCFILIMFAVSNNVGMGALNFSFSLPAVLVDVFGVLRASGRFIWPVWYLVLLFAFYVLFKELNGRQFLSVILLGFLLQVYDTSDGLASIKARWDHPFQRNLKSSLWGDICKEYSSVKGFVSPGYKGSNGELWLDLGVFTSICGLPTNIVRYARSSFSEDAYLRGWSEFLSQAERGRLDKDVLYILDENSAALCRLAIQGSNYGLIGVDGLYVLQPLETGAGLLVK